MSKRFHLFVLLFVLIMDLWPIKPNVVTGSGESNPGLKDGDGGAGEPAGAERLEPEAGAGELWGHAQWV